MDLDLANAKLLVHVVLISFREEVSVEARRQLLTHHQSLGARCGGSDAGIAYWQVSENLDQRHLRRRTGSPSRGPRERSAGYADR